jgi:transcriptional regulator with XRE-family HTH domain
MTERTRGWRTRRLEAGLSLRALSRLSGVNRGTISRIERGWPASPEDAARLVAVLEATEKGDAA